MLVRLAQADDGPALAAIYRPAVVDGATSFELEAPEGAEMAARVERTLARTPWLVAARDARVLGYAYATMHRERPAYQWSVEVSAYVEADARRAGVARALYARLFAVLAAQGFRTAFAGITLPNAASVGLHAALGFEPVGVYRRVGWKRGAWHDVGWFARPLAAYDDAPAPPRPLAECLAEPAWLASLLAGPR